MQFKITELLQSRFAEKIQERARGDLVHIVIESLGVAYSILPGMDPRLVVMGKTRNTLGRLAAVYIENGLPSAGFDNFVRGFIDHYTIERVPGKALPVFGGPGSRPTPKEQDNPYQRGIFFEQIGYDEQRLQRMIRRFYA